MWTKLYLSFAVGFLGIAATACGDEKKLRELEKARVVAAEKAYAAVISAGSLNVTDRYTLSICLMNAQRDFDSSDEVNAYRAHYDRMVALCKAVGPKPPKLTDPRPHLVSASEAFRIEAEYWLEKAKLRNKKRE